MTRDEAPDSNRGQDRQETCASSTAMDPGPMRLALQRMGLLQEGQGAVLTPLAGGIASDIWKVELPDRIVCIKRALHRLKVKADWFVPVERNLYEWRYYEIAGRAAPGAAPGLVAQDTEGYLFVMEYLDPAVYPLWKHQLRDGLADTFFAAKVGQRLATIHPVLRGTPRLPAVPTDAFFMHHAWSRILKQLPVCTPISKHAFSPSSTPLCRPSTRWCMET